MLTLKAINLLNNYYYGSVAQVLREAYSYVTEELGIIIHPETFLAADILILHLNKLDTYETTTSSNS